ncbi:hypothetical protein AKJ60_01185 [candidate division MSBL1 archaeon SCGC-AAA385M11]|nr:hypothetical protein AKJ60_01185 [candidate division MSBL1 archaeon SCGC-AAA385M11]
MSDSVQSPQLDAAMAQEMIRLIPDGLVIINEEQTIVHFNPAAEKIFKMRAENVQERPLDVLLPREVIETHRREVQDFLESEETVRWLHKRRPITARRSDGEPFSYEGTIAKLRFSKGTYLANIMREVTEYLRTEEARQQAKRALMVLSECLEAVIRADKEPSLLREICRIAVDTGQYPFAWIGYAEDDKACTVRPRAQAGQEKSYLEGIRVSWADNEYGQGPTGRATPRCSTSPVIPFPSSRSTSPSSGRWTPAGRTGR